MMRKELYKLKNNYENTPIPDNLNAVVSKGLKKGKIQMSIKNYFRKAGYAVAVFVGAIIILAAAVNTSQVVSSALSGIPVIGGLVRALTIREYDVKEPGYDANIQVPAVEGLDKNDLGKSLNEKYLEEGKQLYDSFMKDMEDLEKNGGGQMGIESGYVVKTDTDRLLSIGRYVVNTVGSSSTVFKYDTIDKQNEILITLPSLFKDDSYVGAISSSIKKQMIEQYLADNNKFYWVDGIEQPAGAVLFDKISPNHNFYINSENKLVISFDKYEVAPGYMGIVEFTIPTDEISNILVSNEYIK